MRCPPAVVEPPLPSVSSQWGQRSGMRLPVAPTTSGRHQVGPALGILLQSHILIKAISSNAHLIGMNVAFNHLFKCMYKS